jgi:hypothetical protein
LSEIGGEAIRADHREGDRGGEAESRAGPRAERRRQAGSVPAEDDDDPCPRRPTEATR